MITIVYGQMGSAMCLYNVLLMRKLREYLDKKAKV